VAEVSGYKQMIEAGIKAGIKAGIEASDLQALAAGAAGKEVGRTDFF
jgi:hypothetical protein